MRTLVLGGARSGKSAWAESLFDADVSGGSLSGRVPVDYVATARPWPGADGFDSDFSARLAVHRKRRPAHWRTVDDVDAVEALRRPSAPFVLVDDVGTWLTNVFDREHLWDSPRGSAARWTDELVAAVRDWGGTGTGAGELHSPTPAGPVADGGEAGVVKQEPHLVIVTPEVGMGVIPEHRSGRLFRDEIGALNGRLADVCDRVVLVVAGLPLTLK